MTHGTRMGAVLAAALTLAGGVSAEDKPAPAPATSDWTIVAAPYLWVSGIEGQSGLFGIPVQNVDVSFGDVAENLDFAFMTVAEARKGPYSIGVDLSYARIGATIGAPVGILATSIDAKIKTFMATAVGGYDVLPSDTANLDLVAGVRFWSVDNKFDFNGGALGGTSASDGDTWVDPVIGVKFRSDISPNLYLAGWGLIGGSGGGSDSMWDVMAGVGYKKSDRMSFFAGYRASSVDYSNAGFVYDVTQKGPIVGGVFRF